MSASLSDETLSLRLKLKSGRALLLLMDTVDYECPRLLKMVFKELVKKPALPLGTSFLFCCHLYVSFTYCAPFCLRMDGAFVLLGGSPTGVQSPPVVD